MELRQLRYFVAVAEERSFTRAAPRLHISQQSLSAAVGQLERQLGYPLLVRGAQGVTPTAAGAALLDRAPAVFAAMDAALAAGRDAAGLTSGDLRLRYGLDSEAFVEPLLAAFQKAHPAIVVRAWTGMDADNLTALSSRDADAAFVWARVPEGFTGVQVGEEEAVLALPDRHRLSRLDVVPVGELENEPLVMFPRDGAPAVFDLLASALGPAAVVEIPVSGQAAMAEAVVRGEGLCPVSATLAARLARPGLVVRPLDRPPRVPLLLAWRGTAGAALRALADHVRHGRAF